MNRPLKIVAIVIGVVLVIIIVIPLFIDANAFRPRLETEMTDALGHQVKVGNLSRCSREE
jgi:AsmA protein